MHKKDQDHKEKTVGGVVTCDLVADFTMYWN